MNINLICSECFKPLDYNIKYDKLQGVIIEVDYCHNCMKDKELIDNPEINNDDNWNKKENKPKYKKGDMVELIQSMPNSDLIYEIIEEPETDDGVNWTYDISDTLFDFKYYNVPEINMIKVVVL